jgi:hypothetical protein
MNADSLLFTSIHGMQMEFVFFILFERHLSWRFEQTPVDALTSNVALFAELILS